MDNKVVDNVMETNRGVKLTLPGDMVS